MREPFIKKPRLAANLFPNLRAAIYEKLESIA